MLVQIDDDYWVDPNDVSVVVADGDARCRIYRTNNGHRDIERPAADIVDLINRATTRVIEAPASPDPAPPEKPEAMVQIPTEDLGTDKPATRRQRPPGGGW